MSHDRGCYKCSRDQIDYDLCTRVDCVKKKTTTQMIDEQLYKDTDVRVIDQRIGMGIGGLNTVVRLYHKPTGILIEMPKLFRSDYHNKMIAFEMLQLALTKIEGE